MPQTSINVSDILRSHGSLKIKAIKLADHLLAGILPLVLSAAKLNDTPIPTPQNALIIRPGGIGDAVYLIPYLKRLRKKYPQLRLDILAERRNAGVFNLIREQFQELYLLDEISSLRRLLKKKYEVVVDTEQWHFLSTFLANRLAQNCSVGFNTRPSRAKLLNWSIPYAVDGHEMQNFANLFAPLLGDNDPVASIHQCLSISPEKKSWAQLQINQPYASLFLGASIALRRVETQTCQEIITYYINKGFSIALIGGKDVVAIGNTLQSKINSPRLKNFCNMTSLEESVALIAQSQLFIGPDSGLLHLACAVGAPTLGIFGPGNLKKWQTLGEHHRLYTKNVACSPCTHFGYTIPTCAKSYHCVRNIELTQMISAANGLLSK